jgi:predicted DNA-binding transcriptional regulator AlpA
MHTIMNSTHDLEALTNERRAAEFLGLSVKTLQKRRVTGDGPKYIRISSRCVRYRRSDLISWSNSLVRTSTSEDTHEQRGLGSRTCHAGTPDTGGHGPEPQQKAGPVR